MFSATIIFANVILSDHVQNYFAERRQRVEFFYDLDIPHFSTIVLFNKAFENSVKENVGNK